MINASRDPTPDLRPRLEHLAEKPIHRIKPIQGGYTPALRLHITFYDGATCFAKIGATPGTAEALRQESRVYQALSGSFMPMFFGWEDHPDSPILLLEDLREAAWPPPWNKRQIRQLVRTLPLVWLSSLPNFPQMADQSFIWNGWQLVAEDPVPFLSLGLTTEAWLQQALSVLLAIDYRKIANGRSLLHGDLRSNNICFFQDRAILVDWNLVCLGNPAVDLGFWLPSLAAEGGPPPEKMLPNAGEIAALVSGFFAARAGLPIIPEAPRVRHIQLVQLKTALPWAVRALGLPPLDGSSA